MAQWWLTLAPPPPPHLVLTNDGVVFVTARCLQLELVPSGGERPVKFEERFRYVDLGLRKRAQESRVQMNALRAGLDSVVPLSLLQLYSWHEVEHLVCGSVEVRGAAACVGRALCMRGRVSHTQAGADLRHRWT